jgi:aspartyl/asparaginyl beta-hydroxylase (cupin superfamily)
MKEGECWEINNNKIHRVANNSEMDRIHLTIDIIPNQYLR